MQSPAPPNLRQLELLLSRSKAAAERPETPPTASFRFLSPFAEPVYLLLVLSHNPPRHLTYGPGAIGSTAFFLGGPGPTRQSLFTLLSHDDGPFRFYQHHDFCLTNSLNNTDARKRLDD